MRLMGFYRDPEEKPAKYDNPIFSVQDKQSDLPEIPGVKVYDMRDEEDVESLKKDAPEQDKHFYENLGQTEQDSRHAEQVEMLK